MPTRMTRAPEDYCVADSARLFVADLMVGSSTRPYRYIAACQCGHCRRDLITRARSRDARHSGSERSGVSGSSG